ncbi:uncharacterized protein LOC131891464 [Tigriopus californicus]|uniref:uncharacterized protein LOC131891464 n=1 Tax=Tigriopus californicus TaxID=6832 RepID=UPI0027DA9118|nr:uncharacterized protein LOC131891464 [Tigriopus californicus]
MILWRSRPLWLLGPKCSSHGVIRPWVVETVAGLPLLHYPQRSCYATEVDFMQQPYAYYRILGIPRNSRMSDVKAAYLRLAKRHHPDMIGKVDEATEATHRQKFDEITEAYTTLIDVTQRHFYDQHGYSCDGLRKKGIPSIFDYQPKWSIHEQEFRADGETSAVEDWFKAQGHSWDEPKTTIRQRLKNAYVEYRWGLKVYDFPWDFQGFTKWFVVLVVFIISAHFIMVSGIHKRVLSLPLDHPHRPQEINTAYGNEEVKDILFLLGIRKKIASDQAKAGLYHLRNAEPAPKRESEFSHTLYSNTRRGEFHRNKDRHRERSELEVKRKEAQLQCEEDLLLQRQADLTEKLKELQDRKAKVINPLNSS